MSEKASKAASILNSIVSILDRESLALKKRNFHALSALSKEKAAMIEKFQEIAENLSRGDCDNSVDRRLETVAVKAKENAEQLSILRNGLSDARRRLENILAQNSLTGAYARDGGKIRNSTPVRAERDV